MEFTKCCQQKDGMEQKMMPATHADNRQLFFCLVLIFKKLKFQSDLGKGALDGQVNLDILLVHIDFVIAIASGNKRWPKHIETRAADHCV